MLNSLFSENFIISMAKPAQYGFQPAYSPIMEGIIDLHHYICFFLVGILTFVVWMLFYTVFQYAYVSVKSSSSVLINKKVSYLTKCFRAVSNSVGRVDYKNAKNLSHWTALEVIWTILPSFILLSIAIPSFILLYSMDELTDDVAITIKVVGHQWYWSYQFSNPSFLNFIENNDPNTFCYDSYMVPWETTSLKDDSLKNNASLRLLQVDKPLWLPIKTHIRFMITSADVIHSWAIPALGVKVDAVPGRLNQTFFVY
jgi:cytochrome c oxidase subunit 2